MFLRYFPTLLIFFLSSCSNLQTEKTVYEKLKEKSYANDPVTVITAVELASAAYLKGCVDARIELGQKDGSFAECQKASANHVQDHIIDILEQPENKKDSL